jgi:hypothetical protein
MFTLLMSFLTGVAGPLLPTIVQLFKTHQDNKQELAMMEMRLKYASQEHAWKMEEINANADIEEAKTLHAPQTSFGVQLLDAANKWADTLWGKWMIFPCFILFTILDFINGMVRPTIAFASYGFYAAYKWSVFELAKVSVNSTQALHDTWGDNDWAVLLMVLGFFFGQRAAKAVLGGSPYTAKANG